MTSYLVHDIVAHQHDDELHRAAPRVWASPRPRDVRVIDAGSNDAQLWMQQDGNLVEYRWSGSSEAVWWASNTAGFVVDGNVGSSSITHIEDNTNFAGDDYRGEFTNDPMQCGQWCASSTWAPSGSSCDAFTWVQPVTSGYSTGVCWLKTGIPAASAYTGATSGYIRH